MAKTQRYNIIIAARAKQMLGIHVRFLANVSSDAARKTKTALLNAIRSLAEMPERYPFFEADFVPPNKYHKMVVESRYLVLYQLKDQIVYVEYILDCRQEYDWLVK